MRAQRSLELDPGRLVTVQELRVRDVRRLLPLLTDPALHGRPLLEMVQQHLPDLLALLADGIILPAGETLEDLSLSECTVIGELWWELHRGFFLRAIGLVGAGLVGAQASNLTGPAS